MQRFSVVKMTKLILVIGNDQYNWIFATPNFSSEDLYLGGKFYLQGIWIKPGQWCSSIIIEHSPLLLH